MKWTRRLGLAAGFVLCALVAPQNASSQTAPLNTITPLCIGGCSTLRIDEVFFAPAASGDAFETHAWIEIANNSAAAIELGDESLIDRYGQTLPLPSITLPAKARLVVVLGDGQDDLDFSAGRGVHFAGEALKLPRSYGLVGLRDANGFRDFVAWDNPDLLGGPELSPVYQQAVDANMWPADEAVSTIKRRPSQRTRRIKTGISIGRAPAALDSNTPADFDIAADKARKPTPGEPAEKPAAAIAKKVRAAAPAQKDWLVMIYSAGDNNLSEDLRSDLAEIQSVLDDNAGVFAVNPNKPNNPLIDAHFVAMADLGGAGNTTWGHLSGRAKGKAGDPDVVLNQIGPAPIAGAEVDSANPESLQKFISWAIANYPSQKKALLISGHGAGWKGLADDASHSMTLSELSGALNGGLGATKLNLIGFDMCEMAGLSVAYQVRNNADYFVASQLPVDGGGFGYAETVEKFIGVQAGAGAAGVSSEQFIKTLVDGASDRWGEGNENLDDWHLSALRLGAHTKAIAKALGRVALELGAIKPTRTPTPMPGLDSVGGNRLAPEDNVQLRLKQAVLDAVAASDGGGGQDFVDLYSLMDKIDKDGLMPAAVRAEAKKAKKALTDAVLYNIKGAEDEDFRGLNLYFPLSQNKPVIERPGAVCDGKDDECGGDPFDKSGACGTFLCNSLVKFGPDGDPNAFGDAVNIPMANASLAFTADYNWHRMLHRYYEPVAAANCDLLAFEGGTITCTAEGSSDSDNALKDYFWDFNPAFSTDLDDHDKDGIDETNDDKNYSGISFSRYMDEGGFQELVLTVRDDLYVTKANRFEADQDRAVVAVFPAHLLDPLWSLGGVMTVGLRIQNITEQPLAGVRMVTGFSVGELVPLSASLSSDMPMDEEVASCPLYSPDGIAQQAYEIGTVPPGAEVTLWVRYKQGDDVDEDGEIAMHTWFQAEGVAEGYQTASFERYETPLFTPLEPLPSKLDLLGAEIEPEFMVNP